MKFSFPPSSDYRKWLTIALFIKSVMFVFFAYHFSKYWPAHQVIGGIFIVSGDTSGYYEPIESFVNGHGYATMCRMPGLLPIYGILYWLIGATWGKVFVIIFQFTASAISVYLLALIARDIFHSEKIFLVTFFIYSLSSFTAIWNHYGLSDSFAISLFIASTWLLTEHHRKNRLPHLLLSGFFIGWAVFFRPVLIIIPPLFLLIILVNCFYNKTKNITSFLAKTGILLLPLTAFLGIWSWSNYSKSGRFMLLQAPDHECFGALSRHYVAIRNLVIDWGGDFQGWSKGTELSWFKDTKDKRFASQVIPKEFITSQYNADSLDTLRFNYHRSLSEYSANNLYTEKVRNSAENFRNSFQTEHPFRYLVLNRFIHLKRFLFPARLDDLPFPSLSEMNLLHKIVKGGYYLLLLIINLFGILGMLLIARQKKLLILCYSFIALSQIVVLGAILGYTEQRYLAPAYPFMVIFTSYCIFAMYNYLKHRFKEFII